MKYLTTIIFVFVALGAKAQISKLTDADKQEALQKATQFCELFSRWCNGERTLDSQIYRLCSGSDCSAYDEVVLQKETTMRNYMLGIQKKYPKVLKIQLSNPSLEKSIIAYEPLLSTVETIREGETPYETSQIEYAQIVSYQNAYIIFDITVSVTSLGKSVKKKIIYDYNTKKITAFITGEGAFLSYIQGIHNMVDGNYHLAIHNFEIAASNNRASLRYSSNCYAMMCCAYLSDIPNMRKYAYATEDEFLINYADGLMKLNDDKLVSSFENWKKCEKLASANSKYEGFMPTVNLEIGLIHALPSDMSPYYNAKLCVDYLKESIKGGNIQAAYLLSRFCSLGEENDFEKYVSEGEIVNYVEWAAKNGHPDCIILLGENEANKGNFAKAKAWFEIGAAGGNALIMAKLGRLLVKQGGNYVAEGRAWLQKSLEEGKLEKYINMYKQDGINKNFWPQSIEDVKKLLNSNTSTSASNYQSSTSSPSYSNTTSSSISSTTTSSNSSYTSSYSNHSHPKRYHSSFNKKKDSFWGGWSFGYIQKQWVFDEDGIIEKGGLFDDEKQNNGIQTGIRIDPQFGAGFGINSGLFYEYCWDKSNEYNDEYGTYHYTYEEHGIYLPVHPKFTMNFSKYFQLSIYGGIGLNYVFAGNLYLRDDGETYGSEDMFSEEDDLSRFNLMLEYGASIRIHRIQFDFSLSKGLNDWSDTNGQKITQNRPFNLSMTFCF